MLVARAPVEVIALDWPEELSAMLLLRSDVAVIGLNRRHSAGRRHFSFWHEVGHYLMHRPELGGRPLACPYEWTAGAHARRMEREANAFAASVLMPSEWVRSALAERRGLADLARWFRVTPMALGRRLVELGLATGVTSRFP